MSQDTAIEWADHTFNPWWGCARVSAACQHCYAETLANRFQPGLWGKAGDRRFFGDKHWNEPRKWDRAAAKAGRPARVFCASMADVFEARDDLVPHRDRLWELIEDTSDLTWLLLTKRPEAIAELVPPLWMGGDWPENVHIGTTIESDEHVGRADFLRVLPAPVRFLSCEPLLGPLPSLDLTGIGQVIVGGESGRGSRPIDPQWVRDLRDACLDMACPECGDRFPWSVNEHEDRPPCSFCNGTGAEDPTAFFFKQWGDWSPVEQEGRPYTYVGGSGPPGYPTTLMWNVGKKAAGRELDGRTWDELLAGQGEQP